ARPEPTRAVAATRTPGFDDRVSADRRAVREPGASPGRSRRCKGRCPSPAVPLARAGKAAQGGAPRQKTCRPPRRSSNPSRKGGFVSKLVLLVVLGVLLLAGSAGTATVPHRIVSLSPTATETLFAIGAGKQVVAVDQQSDYPK